VELLARSVAIGEELLKEDPSDVVTANDLVSDYQARGSRRVATDLPGALKDQQRSLELAQRLVNSGHTDPFSLRGLAFAHKKVGAILIKQNQLVEGAAHYEAARQLDERLVARAPNDPGARFDLTFTLSDMGLIAWRQRDTKRALELYLRVLEIREGLAREDAKNMRARWGIVSTCNYLQGIYRESGDWKTAVRYTERALEANQELLRADPKDVEAQAKSGWLHMEMGFDFAAGRRRGEAEEQYRTAMETGNALKARGAQELVKAAEAAIRKQ
jgi:tetratricopeptide (TPR) repeat protein